MSDASLKILFFSLNRAFDADHPIKGRVKIDTARDIPAYGILIKLELTDMVRWGKKVFD